MPTETTTSLLEAALDYARRGWRVFPVRTAGKHPMTEHGLKDATTDQATIRDWWGPRSNANIAIATGGESGIAVVDVDPRNGGDESLLDLVARYGPLSETPEVLTGGGGRHLYFAYPESGVRSCDLGPGLELKSDGRYVVAPPSLHASGRRYTWEVSSLPEDVPVAPLPPWMLDMALPKAKDRPSTSPNGTDLNQVARAAQNLQKLAPRRCDEYDSWLQVGMALSELGDTGLSLWDSWSRKSGKYQPGVCADKWRTFEPGHGVTLRSLAYWAQEDSGQAQGPSEAPQALSWPKPLNQAGLWGLAGDITRAIAPVTEADPVAVLAHVLAAFGNAAGDGHHALVQHDKHPARVFFVLVGDTAKGRKGTSWSEPKAIMSEAAPGWTARVRQGGLSSGEGLIYQVRDHVTKTEPVREKGKPTGEFQEVLVDPGVDDKRLFVLEPEFAQALAVMRREGNILSPIVRQAWDSGDLAPMVKNNPTVATGAHISIVGHITKTELLARLDETTQANGFANRFIWLAVRRANILSNGGGLTDDQISQWGAALAQVIQSAKGVGQVRRDSAAEELWGEIYGPLSEGLPGLLGAILGRAEAQVLRLSLVYALLDHSAVIRVPHLKAALALWDYSVESARWIFGDALGDPVADRLLAVLKASPGGMDSTEVRDLFQRNVSAGRIHQALEMLLSRGLIIILQREPPEGDTGRGRPRTVYLYRSYDINDINDKNREG